MNAIGYKDIPWADIHALADWLKRINGSDAHEQAVQMMKIGEEIGEFHEATYEESASELCDIALTALVALRGWHARPDEVYRRISYETPARTSLRQELSVAYGRLCSTYIGYRGQNPRKGATHTYVDVENALATMAAVALTLLEVLCQGGVLNSAEVFRAHLAHVVQRAALMTGA